ncbi:phosphonate transport system ATP-binding protein [Mycoplasmoides fastidiosum]|uniref:Phosphonate transport system ATP-binding protein n=1 Tax=Mycoplasmoides fastidiosum TaxID=92758 RepID=A0ABU0LZE6_9BACT|nr:ATP-binding cassette domain-containing protein [Mycoplasmoides fastidiosum]MDQ0514077.1 phosphonate transport system ATP-binding protein [Mycoplasmoides fastidiosum]UUD37513.1 ATP-binding cassette domain-containing protein [Mycoplasmoides fastidiosum]
MTIIEFQQVNIVYDHKDVPYLRNISFQINENDVVCVIGKSGAGKTTLMNAIFQPDRILSGKIYFDQHDLTQLSVKQRKKLWSKIGYLSQTSTLFEDDTVYLAIKRDFLHQQVWWQKIFFYLNYQQRTMIFQTLKELGILNKAFTKIGALSQGQKQRVEIAKLLLKKPRLILADEPTTSLDPATAKLTIALIKKLQQIHQCCIIINIHDVNLLKMISNKTIAIKNQTIHFIKPTQNVNANDLELVYQ